MGTDKWFDDLAKDSAQRLPRRQVFGRLLGAAGVAALSALGLLQAKPDCAKLCEECCHNAFPDGGRDYGQCVSDCHHGAGLCGPLVCPD
jgi:hypothetical protein